MRKLEFVSLSSLIFLALSSFVAYLLRFIETDSPWLTLAIGVMLLIIGALCCIFTGKNIVGNILVSCLIAISLGFLLRSWYILRGFDNPLWLIILSAVGAVLYLWVFYFLSKIPLFRKHAKGFIIIFVLASLIAYAALVFTTETTFISTLGYYAIVELGFIFAMCKSNGTRAELIRNLTLSTFSIFAIAVFIAIMILLDGDGDFDFDIDFGLEVAGDTAEAVVDNKKKKNGDLN